MANVLYARAHQWKLQGQAKPHQQCNLHGPCNLNHLDLWISTGSLDLWSLDFWNLDLDNFWILKSTKPPARTYALPLASKGMSTSPDRRSIVRLIACLFTCLSVCLSVSVPSVCLSSCTSVCLSVCLFVCLSVRLLLTDECAAFSPTTTFISISIRVIRSIRLHHIALTICFGIYGRQTPFLTIIHQKHSVQTTTYPCVSLTKEPACMCLVLRKKPSFTLSNNAYRAVFTFGLSIKSQQNGVGIATFRHRANEN